VPKRPAVALHGFVYSTNFGDMLLSRLTADIIRRRLPNVFLGLPFASDVFLESAGIEGSSGLSTFFGADALVYHGGGYLAFPPGFELFTRARLYKRFYLPGLAAQALRKPYGIFAVGVGPIRSATQSKVARRLFQGASMISVRDEEGRDWLRRIGVTNGNINLAADLAVCLDWTKVPGDAVHAADEILKTVPGDKRVGLHLSEPSSTSSGYAAVIRGVLAYLDRHPEIGVALICDHLPRETPEKTPQYRAAVELQKHLGGRAKFVGQPPMWTLVALLGKLDGLITNKLHAGIVSSAFGRRAVAIAKNSKNTRFFRQIGAETRCMHMDEATSADIPQFLEQGFESLGVPTPVPPPVKDLARSNERLIGRFLETCSL
jgi:polysaccharide pyruvyl transferase WcaK-like protein